MSSPAITETHLNPRRQWRHVDEAHEVPIEGDVTVPALMWREHGDALSWRDGRTGVRIGPGDSLDALGPFLARIALVELETPAGCEASNAARQRRLRERFSYAGDIHLVETTARSPRRVRGPAPGNGPVPQAGTPGRPGATARSGRGAPSV